MNRIEWSENFSTGHGPTDAQHKGIISDCNIMIEHLSSGDTARCSQAMSDCLRNCEQHFVEESTLLRSLDGIDPSEPFSDHQQILVHLNGLKKKCEKVCSGQACVSEVLHTIISHMLKHDLKIRQHFIY